MKRENQRPVNEQAKTEKIAQLNDSLRKSFMGGEVCITRGVCDLLKENNISTAKLRKTLFLADDFNEDNDPYGEHDF